MNWEHLTAFLWLRWRLSVNHWRRAGRLNSILGVIFAVGALALAGPLFVGCFALGLYVLPKMTPTYLLYAWDGLVVGFLFFWSIGLLTDLQKSESLSLSNFLHLPVSIQGVFLINYFGSLVRLSLIVFVPVMCGFGLALVISKGPTLLVALPLVAAFLLMVTGLTYQFQGWLTTLMANPRRRRTVIVVMTGLFMLVTQLPNVLNFSGVWGMRQHQEESRELQEALAELNRTASAQKIEPAERMRLQNELLEKIRLAREQRDRERGAAWDPTGRLANMILPIGWLPLGIRTAAEGNFVPGLLGFLGMTSIGAGSLWRAYRTTIRIYQGQYTAKKSRPTPIPASPAGARKPRSTLLEARLPGLSEPVSAIALGGWRALLRSPEAKMMLLTPLFLGVVFGSALLRGPRNLPDAVRPLLAIGGMVFVLSGVLQLMANQFGLDRDGFRVFVLCAAPRRDILLGKNLAFAPLALGMALVLLVVLQMVFPLRIEHLVAMVPQFVSMFFLFCLVANGLSIFTPIHLPAGSLKPANPKFVPILLQILTIFCIFPLTQAPTLLPLGIEVALEYLEWSAGLPICLVLTIAQCAAVVLLYRQALNWQGRLLQEREQQILETVTNRGA